MYVIFLYEGLSEKFFEILKESGIESYSYINDTRGAGKNSGKHLGDDVWPQKNVTFLIHINDEEKEKVFVSKIKKLREENLKYGVKVFKLASEVIF
jgi:hypothetical protein